MFVMLRDGLVAHGPAAQQDTATVGREERRGEGGRWGVVGSLLHFKKKISPL